MQGLKKLFPPRFYKVALIVGILSIFVSLIVFSRYRAKNIISAYEIKGIVSQIRYCEKKHPYVIVNNKEYYLSRSSWQFNPKIEIGDSVVKQKNELKIRIIKNKTGEINIYE